MSDYELLTAVLMILGIIVSILIAYINHTVARNIDSNDDEYCRGSWYRYSNKKHGIL